jgi:hypothetical protein
MISARRLAQGANIELTMGSDPSRGLGDLYVAATDGFVLDADLISNSHLKCIIEPAVTEATTKIFSRTKPAKITVNGREDDHVWNYDESSKIITIHSSGRATIEVFSD